MDLRGHPVESCLQARRLLKTIDHPIILTGPEFQGTFFRPEAMAFVEKRLPEVLRDAVRMRVFASSRKIGRPGLVVEAALDLWLGDVRKDEATGGTAMTARVPTLGEAAPRLFDQGLLWEEDGLQREDTVFDLLGDVVRDVRVGKSGGNLLEKLPAIPAKREPSKAPGLSYYISSFAPSLHVAHFPAGFISTA